jgi:hypothetical protein
MGGFGGASFAILALAVPKNYGNANPKDVQTDIAIVISKI